MIFYLLIKNLKKIFFLKSRGTDALKKNYLYNGINFVIVRLVLEKLTLSKDIYY